MRRAIAMPLLAAALACGVIACGDDEGSDAAGDGAKATPSAAKATPTEAAAKPSVAGTDEGSPAAADAALEELGDFGRAPTRAERVAIVAAVDRYHAAVAADDDARICASMSRAGKRALSRNVAGASSPSCVDHVGVLYTGYTDKIRKGLLDARITAIRVKGDHALVIAVLPGRTIRLPMDRDQGT